MIKFIGFILSALTAILVITNGNGSLFQNAFGDSDSIEDSVNEIVESAEEESDDVRDEAEDIAEEAREDADIDDDVRDRDNDEDEVEDEDDNDNYDDTSSDLESEVEDKVREVEDNVEEDDIDDIPGLGEGSGMQIFVSPRERVNEILDQHTDDIEEQVSNPPPTSAPRGVGASPGEIAELPDIAALIQDTEDIIRETVDSIIASGVVSDGQPQLILDALGDRDNSGSDDDDGLLSSPNNAFRNVDVTPTIVDLCDFVNC